jgi:hypothetical protein
LSWRAGCVFALLVLSGCGGGGGGPARVAVSGRVTLDGRADAEGRVRFAPAKGEAGPVASTAVKGGVYRFTTADGPVEGAHDVVFELIPAEAAAPSTTPSAAAGPKGGGVSPFVTIVREAVVDDTGGTVDFELQSPAR